MLIDYSGAIINVNKIVYAKTVLKPRSSSYESKIWQFVVTMEGGKEIIWSGFKTQDDAMAKYKEFWDTVQKTGYVIQELV